MKLLHTNDYNGDPVSINAENILAIRPSLIKRHMGPGQFDERPGCSIMMSTSDPNGCTYQVLETYDCIIKKLESL